MSWLGCLLTDSVLPDTWKLGITETLRNIWLFSTNKIKSSESLSKQPTQLNFELNSLLRHIIVTQALTTLRCALLTKRLQLAPRRLISLSKNNTNNGLLPSVPAVPRNASISTFFKRHHQTQSASTDITVSGKWYYMFKLDESTQLWPHSYASTWKCVIIMLIKRFLLQFRTEQVPGTYLSTLEATY